MISVVIPARNEDYLQQTIDSLLDNAREAVEIIVVLDGYWPVPPLKSNKQVHILHRSKPLGMQHGVNSAARMAFGKYLMKVDAHCLFSKDWDVILKNDCEENWLVTLPRYSLDVEKWERKPNRLPVSYNTLTFPYTHDNQFGTGFHGKKWTDGNLGYKSYYGREMRRKDVLIDDVIAIQGSLWFMHRQYFFDLDGQDEYHSNFFQEPQEMVFKVWLSGGRCVVNKKAWYAHWHKNKGSGYGWSMGQKKETERFSTWIWMNDKWPKQTRKFKWLIDKFLPMAGWPEDWESYIKDETEPFRIFDAKGNDGYKIESNKSSDLHEVSCASG